MKRLYPKQKYDKFASIRDMLDFAAEKYGDKVQYRYFTKGTEIGEMTFRQFREAVDRVGTALAARGLRGATVAILAESRPEWMVSFCAVVCGGGMVVSSTKFSSYSYFRMEWYTPSPVPDMTTKRVPGARRMRP